MFSYQERTSVKTGPPVVQPKLKIGQPDDIYEQEADAVANRVMRMNEGETMRMQPIEEEEEKMQSKLRMQPIEEEEEMLQTKPGAGDGFASPEINQLINTTKGNGKPLTPESSHFMGNAFNADFNGVKLHTGSEAEQMNLQLGARAFTFGNNIYFNKGEYNTGSSDGKKLLAHELTHTLQQRGGIIQRDGVEQAPPRTDTRYGLGIRNRFGLYDATLNRDTRTLTLQMRIAFNYTGSWPSDTAKTEWFNEFKRLIENRWSYRYYLVPDGTCRFSEDQRTYYGRLNVEQVTSNPHFNVDVAYTTTHLGSSANSVSRTASLDSMDTQERNRESDGREYRQRGVEHEFGHMLGVAHIECNAVTGVCPEGDQYGDTPGEASDIMGMGWIVSERNYFPFTAAMYYFTGCNWSASHEMYNP